MRYAALIAVLMMAACCRAADSTGIPEFRIDSLSPELRAQCKQFREGQRNAAAWEAVTTVLGQVLPKSKYGFWPPSEINELRQKMTRTQFVELFGEPSERGFDKDKNLELLHYVWGWREPGGAAFRESLTVYIREGIVAGCSDVLFH